MGDIVPYRNSPVKRAHFALVSGDLLNYQTLEGSKKLSPGNYSDRPWRALKSCRWKITAADLQGL
jgi:hypothetical protein